MGHASTLILWHDTENLADTAPRIRKVKCDEAKPYCQRCSTTGRNCDGYADITPRSSNRTSHATDIIKQISTHIAGNKEERRGFEFFLSNTAVELTGYFDSSFWERLLLAASSQKPALRHAVIALGSLHEDALQKRQQCSSESENARNMHFAALQYAKAIRALRTSLSEGREEPLTALMSCILFVCFDSLRGSFESAMIHLRSGHKVLQETRRSTGRDHIIDNYISPLFHRLSVQSIIYVDALSSKEKIYLASEMENDLESGDLILEDFNSLQEARNALNEVMDGLFGTYRKWE